MDKGLTPFLDIHAGETAWVFGKGPGLNSFDISKAGPLKCAINDVAAHIPDARYCFANDDVGAWRDIYRKGQTLFQPARALKGFKSDEPGAVECDVVVYQDEYDERRLDLPPAELVKSLAVSSGTLGSVIQILRIMGVARIVAVGIDGGNGHAEGYEWRTKAKRDHWKDYNRIRDDAIADCEQLGIELTFHNPQHTMETDGKVFVKMKRNCFAEGQPLTEGQVVKLNPKQANLLIGLGMAARHEGGPPARESATLDTSTAEAAVQPKAKGKRPSK